MVARVVPRSSSSSAFSSSYLAWVSQMTLLVVGSDMGNSWGTWGPVGQVNDSTNAAPQRRIVRDAGPSRLDQRGRDWPGAVQPMSSTVVASRSVRTSTSRTDAPLDAGDPEVQLADHRVVGAGRTHQAAGPDVRVARLDHDLRGGGVVVDHVEGPQRGLHLGGALEPGRPRDPGERDHADEARDQDDGAAPGRAGARRSGRPARHRPRVGAGVDGGVTGWVTWPILPPGPIPRLGGMLRLMHVHAHPDDESSKGAASTAKYVAEGRRRPRRHLHGRRARVDPEPEDGPPRRARQHDRDPPRRRWRRPARSSAYARTGSGSSTPAGPRATRSRRCPEGCFGLVDPQVAAEPLVRLIRSFRPHVLTTYDENGGYPHPDHIMCHNVSMAALEAAADPERFPDAGEPWQVLKVYYQHGFNRPRTLALHEAMLADGHRVAVHRPPRGVEAGPRPRRPDHHPGALRRLLRGP